jgi:hypothetical protein
LGVSRILDPMLLEEVINFGPDVNVDRIVAAECALVLANELDPLLGSHSNSKSQDRLSALRKVLSGKSSTFSNVKTTWSLRK